MMNSLSSAKTKLNIVIPTYNRPLMLHRSVSSSLLLGLSDYEVVVIDDGSTVSQVMPDGIKRNTEEVMDQFDSPHIRYIRKINNAGLGSIFESYVTEHITGEYAIFINDDDVFIDPEPVHKALKILEHDPSLSIVFMSLIRRSDNKKIDQCIDLPYPPMSGKDFFRKYSEDYDIRHTALYGILRTKFIHETGAMQSIGLQKYGLHDAFGIDTDLLFRLLTKGGTSFVDQPFLLRRETAGLTERFPVMFAYCYYQYILRGIKYQKDVGFDEKSSVRKFLRSWYRVMLMMYNATLFSPLAEERGEEKIRQHLRIPFHIYLIKEMWRHGIFSFEQNDAKAWFWSTWKYAWQNKNSFTRYFFTPRRSKINGNTGVRPFWNKGHKR